MRFEIYRDKAGEFRFRLIAANGEVIAASEGYKNKTDCLSTIGRIKTEVENAIIDDLTV